MTYCEVLEANISAVDMYLTFWPSIHQHRESILTLVPYIPVNRTCKHFDQQMLYYLPEIVSQAPFSCQKPIPFRKKIFVR